MADTMRSLAALQAILPDNSSGDISPQDLRDFLVSAYQPQAIIPGGRLTLTTGVPVTTADVTSSTSVFYAPFIHNCIGLYDGTSWKLYTYSQLTFALGTLSSGANYDLFVWDNAGTVTLSAGPAWTGDATRGTGAGTTELVLQDGVYVNNVAISGGPGAKAGRYVGSFRTISTTATADFAGGTSQTGGKRFLWNAYNRRQRHLEVIDTTNSWTYSTATWRQVQATAGNKVEYLCGLSEDEVKAEAVAFASTDNASPIMVASGVGVDATNANSAKLVGAHAPASISLVLNQVASKYKGFPGIGYHYLAWLEISTATGNTTWYGDNNATILQAGLTAEVWC